MCANIDERFSDGYTQKISSADYKVSPAMDTDISCGYLPNNTWLIENMFHGMMYKDSYSDDLLEKLLLTDEIEDVNSDPNFPQFHANTSPSSGIWAAFDNSKEGFVSSADTKLTVKNLSTKYKLKIMSVKNNMGLNFDFANTAVLNPGETAEISFSGKLQNTGLAKKEIVIDFVLLGSITPLCERTLNFTLMNGENALYDGNKPTSPLCEKNLIDRYAPENTVGCLKRFGLEQTAVMVVNIITSWVGILLGGFKK